MPPLPLYGSRDFILFPLWLESTPMSTNRELALDSKTWPFEEARKVLKRVGNKVPAKGYVLFETGYGPSGLPHIGTFGEVARTTMVRRAFEAISDIPTKLFAFSDDMDGLRKVPDNVPNKEELALDLGKALTSVRDPFGTHPSFGEHNNARLQAFLDQFGFQYDFKSSTDCYKSGIFDETLLKVLAANDKILEIILPTLGEERRKTYSPFMPVDPETGEVYQVPVLELNPSAGTLVYEHPSGEKRETSVLGGACKLQWKCDWAMRWVALDVDYEMAGKDLIDSVKLGNQIARAIQGRGPEGFNYELFLDENAKKISKSVGNGIAVEDWLRYAAPESLSLYMFQNPKKAKRLYFDVIPKAVDEYLTFLEKFEDQTPEERLKNPVWHIHRGQPPAHKSPVSFSMLLNLVSASNAHEAEVLWGFIRSYAPDASAETHPFLAGMVENAIAYYEDFVKPNKQFRAPSDEERKAIEDLRGRLAAFAGEGAEVQNLVFEVGKDHGFENLRDWFKALYEVLLGQSQGPRMGSFIALYGVDNMVALIDKALAGELS